MCYHLHTVPKPDVYIEGGNYGSSNYDNVALLNTQDQTLEHARLAVL